MYQLFISASGTRLMCALTKCTYMHTVQLRNSQLTHSTVTTKYKGQLELTPRMNFFPNSIAPLINAYT